MTRYSMTTEGNIPFAPEQEAIRDAEEALWASAVQRNNILGQIDILEAQQTPRRIAEAVLGEDNGWLKNLRDQIATLRSQLT